MGSWPSSQQTAFRSGTSTFAPKSLTRPKATWSPASSKLGSPLTRTGTLYGISAKRRNVVTGEGFHVHSPYLVAVCGAGTRS